MRDNWGEDAVTGKYEAPAQQREVGVPELVKGWVESLSPAHGA